MKIKFGLLPRVVLAIGLGVACGFFLPGWATRIALTFNAIFGQFLGFVIPLLILGLVAPGIADLGKSAGRLLALTAALAYAFTLFSGFGTYFTGRAVFPALLEGSAAVLPEEGTALTPYFTVEMPPVMGVMSALVLAFVLGLGMAYIHSVTLKGAMDDFKRIIDLVILRVIIPLLPFYIFGIFLSMTQSGQVAGVLGVFVKLIAVIFCMTVVLLVVQFSIAGLVARKNPLKMLRTMLTAYVTALGTQSSAATIPVTLAQTVKLGVRPELASFRLLLPLFPLLLALPPLLPLLLPEGLLLFSLPGCLSPGCCLSLLTGLLPACLLFAGLWLPPSPPAAAFVLFPPPLPLLPPLFPAGRFFFFFLTESKRVTLSWPRMS